MFRCHVEETAHGSALEIPEWMFDSSCRTMCPVDAPVVSCQALRSLKELLAGASRHDPMVKEAQRFEGGADATDTESKTISIGIIPSINTDSGVGSNAPGGKAKDDPAAITIVTPALGKPTQSSKQGGRR